MSHRFYLSLSVIVCEGGFCSAEFGEAFIGQFESVLATFLLYCFRQSFFFLVSTITYELLHSARGKFSMNMYLDNPRNPENFKGQGHRTGLLESLPLQDGSKKIADMLTHEPLHEHVP